MGISLLLQVFGHKIMDNFILMLVHKSVRSERINKVITFHPEGNMNVCITFLGNLSSSCQGISNKTTNVDLMAIKGIIKVTSVHPHGTMNVCNNFYENTYTGCLTCFWP